MKKSNLLTDNDGNFSTMRVMSFIALLTAIAITFTNPTFDILMIWVVAAFAPKAIQKFAEK